MDYSTKSRPIIFCTDVFREMQKTAIQVAIISALLFSFGVMANTAENFNRHFEYQQAAPFTHLQWHHTTRPLIPLQLNPIVNFSGIPMEQRDEKPEYYYHGKPPMALNAIIRDTIEASHVFNLASNQPDYVIDFFLDQYQLPFDYAPDDVWWQKLHDQTDRWLQNPNISMVKLSVKVSGGAKPMKTWMDSVSIRLSDCDLNQFPQPSSEANSSNKIIRNYLSTTPGQAFLAASNFLIMQATQRLREEPALARITSTFDQEIHLASDNGSFVQGELLDVYYNSEERGKSSHAAGKIKVIHAMQNEAIAYPVTLRADHVKAGDWVEMHQLIPFEQPQSQFQFARQCAKVSTAQLN